MPIADEEATWRAEFEESGEDDVRRWLNMMPEPKRQFAFRWLRAEAKKRTLREQQTYRYVQWTFWAALAAVVVGIGGVLVTWFGLH